MKKNQPRKESFRPKKTPHLPIFQLQEEQDQISLDEGDNDDEKVAATTSHSSSVKNPHSTLPKGMLLTWPQLKKLNDQYCKHCGEFGHNVCPKVSTFGGV